MPDSLTPIEEILRGLDDLVASGKILHGGLSNFPAWRTARASVIAELHSWAPIIGVQIEYSLVERGADREQLPMVEALGMGAALFSPLGGGLLTGKYRTSDKGRLSDWKHTVHREDTPQRTAIVDSVLEVAGEVGAPPSQVAMAWVRGVVERSTTACVPVIGPRDTRQLEDYLRAMDLVLDDEQMQRLSDVSAVVPIVADATISVRAGVDAGLVIRPIAPTA
jgi:aryl-alcohol dehydrogenase-like predicted oxidoreductase